MKTKRLCLCRNLLGLSIDTSINLDGDVISMNKAMIFIDGSNVYHGMRRFFPNHSIDYAKLLSYLSNGRYVVRAYYYGSLDTRSPNVCKHQEAFVKFLQHTGYEVDVKPLRYDHQTRREKGLMFL